METQIVVAIISALGGSIIGGVVGSYFQSKFQYNKELQDKLHKDKRSRYGALSILMYTRLNPNEDISKLKRLRPDLKNLEDLDKELDVELLHSILFANNKVIKALNEFNSEPNKDNFIEAHTAMRQDLWGRIDKIGDINIFKKVN